VISVRIEEMAGNIYQLIKNQEQEMRIASLLCSFAICAATALSASLASAGTFWGTVCFKTTNYNDVYIWNIEYTAGADNFTTLTIAGKNMDQNRGMSGGGVIAGNVAKLFIGESAFSSPIYLGQLHSIVLDLTSPTWAGTDDIVLHKADGTHSLIRGEPIGMVACPK